MLTKEERSAINKRNRAKRKKVPFTGFPVGMLITDTPEYKLIHTNLRRLRGAAKNYQCVNCFGTAQDWAYVHNTDPFDIYHYVPRCRDCHNKYDGFLKEQSGVKNNNGSKLTDDDVREIKRLYSVMTQAAIAKRYDVSKTTIARIINGQRWSHVE